MTDLQAIKLAAELATPFDAATFARISRESESDAASTLNRLVGRGWLEAVGAAGAGGLGGTYRLSPAGRAAAV